MLQSRSAWSATTILLAAAWTFAPSRAFAQFGGSDHGELSARGGIAFGGGSGGIGAQPLVAGSAGAAFSRYAMVLLDTSYMPLGQHTIQGWPARETVDRSHLLDFAIDFHIRIPIKERMAPYAIVGAGLLWNMVRQNTSGAAGIPVTNHYDQFNGALHTGGGLRYYVGENWGFRPEVKVMVSKQVYTCVSFGVFYVVPAFWP